MGFAIGNTMEQETHPAGATVCPMPTEGAPGEDAPRTFTLEDLNFGGTNYKNMIPETRHYGWWGDELIRCDEQQVVVIDKAKGTETVLLTLDDIQSALPADDKYKLTSLTECSFPYAGKPLALVVAGGQRMLYNLRTKEIEWSQSTEKSLEWNAKSRTDAYLDHDNLWLRLNDGTTRQLSTDGSREIVYGQSVHRNEFGIEKGTFFAPDGQKLAFYRMDQSMVTDYPQVNTGTRSATYEPDKYPMAGMTSHEVTIGVHDIAANKTIYLNVGEPKDRYFTNIAWSPDGSKIYLYEVNREQNRASLDEYNSLTGEKMRTLDIETDSKYVEPMHPITFLPWDERKFIAWSQKDGYWHLYLYDAINGKQISQLTKGEYVVLDIAGFNKDTRSVIIRANKSHPLSHNLYAVNTDNGNVSSLDGGDGVHYAALSASGRYMIDIWERHDVPRKYELGDVRKAVASTWNNGRRTLFVSKDPWAGYAVPTFKTGSLTAADDSTELYWRMVLPPDFDATKKYPTVVYVYGGPHANIIQDSWHAASRSWETYMAQKGYIIFILDNRGAQYRGKAFEQVTWHRLGQVEMQDQMKGVEYLRSLPFVDANRLGIHGWSYGGYMTISLMTTYPDVFKVGVAGGPVIDWKWYEVMYGERYMGTPQSNPDGYAQTSLLDKAKNLKGRLEIIIGMNDATVVPQHALNFIYQCNINGIQPDFYVYPGEEHNMRGHQSVHLHERITRYFDDFLK